MSWNNGDDEEEGEIGEIVGDTGPVPSAARIDDVNSARIPSWDQQNTSHLHSQHSNPSDGPGPINQHALGNNPANEPRMRANRFVNRPPRLPGMGNRHASFSGTPGQAPPVPPARSQSLTAASFGFGPQPAPPPGRPTDPRFRNSVTVPGQGASGMDRRPSNEGFSLKPPPPPGPPPGKSFEEDQRQPFMRDQHDRRMSFDHQQPPHLPNRDANRSSYSSLVGAEAAAAAVAELDQTEHHGPPFRRPSYDHNNFIPNANNDSEAESGEYGFRGENNGEEPFRRPDTGFRGRDGDDFRREPGFPGRGPGRGRGPPAGRDGPFGRRRSSDFRGDPNFPGSDFPPNLPFTARGRGSGRGRGDSYYGPPGPPDSNQPFHRSPTPRGRFGGRGGRGPPGRGSFPLNRTPSGGRGEGRFGSGLDFSNEGPRSFNASQEEGDGSLSFASMADRPNAPQQERPQFRTSNEATTEPGQSDTFGRSREWAPARSPQSSPRNRKPVSSLFQIPEESQESTTVVKPPPPPPPSQVGSEVSTPQKEAANSASKEEEKPKPPPPLTTDALGDQSIMERAEHAIGVLKELTKDTDSNAEEGETSKLPAKQVLFKAMALLDANIKAKQDMVTKKAEESESEAKNERELEEKAQAAKEAEENRIEKEKLKLAQEKEEAERKQKDEDYEKLLQEGKAIFEKTREEKIADLKARLDLIHSEEARSMESNTDSQVVAAAKGFEEELQTAKNNLDRFTQAATKTEGKLVGLESELKSKFDKASQNNGSARAVDMSGLISAIMTENRRKAAEAHVNFFATATSHDASVNLKNQFELEYTRDPKEGKTHAEWSELSQQVTGLGDALYSQPSEAPYFQTTEENHKEMEPMITEVVRRGKDELKNHWTELAEEYEWRNNVFKKKWKKRTSSAKARSRLDSIMELVPRQAVIPMLESGGERPRTQTSSTNPYRRARRGNEVRTDYEQEQIIAEIAEKEAMDKKIEFGGSALPRQLGPVENKITAKFYQSFNSHKFDPYELEADLGITNLWTDMEKCIFLDRFMHHPKDFRKIASFLRNKTTVDCVAFYYDSKQTVPYKSALKEFIMRRKRRGDYHVWDATIQSALSVGAVVKAGPNEDKPLVFLLPSHEDSYATSKLHPLKQEILMSFDIDEGAAQRYLADEKSEKSRSRKRNNVDSLFVVDRRETKFLKVPPEPKEKLREKAKEGSGKSGISKGKESGKAKDGPKPKEGKAKTIRVDESDEAKVIAAPGSSTPRRAPQKWTATEKQIFLETLEKHGRDWQVLSDAVGTKTTAQIKNFYYDHKKQLEKGKKDPKKAAKGDKAKRKDGRTTPVPQGKSDASTDMLVDDASLVLSPQPGSANDVLSGATVSASAATPKAAGEEVPDRAVPSQAAANARQELWAQTQNSQHGLLENQLQQLQQAHAQQLPPHDIARLLSQQPQSQQQQQLLSTYLPWLSRPSGLEQGHPESQQLQVLLERQLQQQQLQAQQASQRPLPDEVARLLQLQQQHQQSQQSAAHQHLQSLGLSNYMTSQTQRPLPDEVTRLLQLHQQPQQQVSQSAPVDDRLSQIQQLLGGGAGGTPASLGGDQSRLQDLLNQLQRRGNPGA